MANKIALIGYGAANMLFAAYLINKERVDPRRLIIIDPYHDGGALLRQWACVRSNTTYRQFSDAVRQFGIEAPLVEQPEEPTPLQQIAHALVAAVRPLVERADKYFAKVTECRLADGQWHIRLSTGQTLQAAICSLAPGAEPRILQTGVPQIPLAAALHLPSLQNYICPGSTKHVTVFGTAHSGTLIAENVVAAGATCSLVHLGPQPFLFASEGAYDGVKQDAERIARSILADGLGGKVTLVQYEQALDVHAALCRADYAVCACGFETTAPSIIVDGRALETLKGLPYNPATAEIAPRLFGWGIAFPSKTTIDNRTYVDVSIPSFTAHILAQHERIHGIL